MKCPICDYTNLIKKESSDGLPMFHCEKCDGRYLRYEDYGAWLKRNPEIKIENTDNSYLPEFDSKQAKLCPDCGRILIKYKIDTENDYYLDYCRTCGSVWFDKNEFEFIKSKNLHNKINLFFTADWQNKLKNHDLKADFDKQYSERFGNTDYEKVKELKKWIDENENKKEIISYLLDNDPYEI